MQRAYARPVTTSKNGETKICRMSPVKCFPAFCTSTKVSRRERKRRRSHVEKITWCGFRSVVTKLTAGISSRRGISTRKSEKLAETRPQSSLSTKARGLTKEFLDNARNVQSTAEESVGALQQSLKDAVSKKDGTRLEGSVKCL